VRGDERRLGPPADEGEERRVGGRLLEGVQALVGQVADARGEAEAQQVAQPEELVGDYVDKSRGSFGLIGGGKGLAEVSEEVFDAAGGGVMALNFA
jgi:hypothetical protein